MSALFVTTFTGAIDGVLLNHQDAWERAMSDGTIEECVDELDGFVDTLTRYSEPVLAVALRVHLAALLGALLESHALTTTQVREFLRDLDRDVFDEDAGAARGD